MRTTASPTLEVLKILGLEEREALFQFLGIEVPQRRKQIRVSGFRNDSGDDIAVAIGKLMQFLAAR